MTMRDSERGNVFFALFGAVALVGVIGAATSTLMRGPVSTVMSVNQRTKADTQMQIASKLAMVRAAQQANNGDCDSDGTIEAMLPDAFATGPSGGGALPASIGASQIDPWNTKYGYCVWDLGAVVDDAACGGPSARLQGGNNMSYPVMVIMSAGPDKTFQTTCNDWVDTAPADGIPDNATTLINKPAGSDDIILSFTYSEAVQAAGGLWSLMSGDPNKITTDKDVAFSSGTNVDFSAGTTANFQGTAQFADNSRLDLGLGGLFLLPDDTELPDGQCNAVNNGALRLNLTDYAPATILEMCDKNIGFVALGGAGATVSKIDDLTDATSYPADDVLFMGQDAGLAYSSSTGAGNNIGIGIGAASALVTGGGNIVLGNNIPLSAGTNDTLRIGQFLSGSNIYSSSGSMTIGGALDVGAGLTVGATAQAARFQVDGTAGFMDSSGTGMILGAGASTVVTIESGGNVGIGVADPNVALDVSGDAQISGDTTSDHFLATAGSAAGPSFSFGSGSGLGMYNAGASALGFATSGINRVTIDNTGLGIGTSPSVALDVAGAGEFTGSVTAGSFQFSSGQGMFPAGAGINLTGGNVGIGQASPATTLDVNGEVRIGGSLSTNCTAGIIGAVRFASGDQLEVCLSTGWAVVGASSGGGSGSGSNWTKLGDNRLYYIQNNVGVMTNDPQADFHIGGNLLATGTFGAGDATPVAGAGTRMMFVPNKGAFRAGYVGGTQWDHATIGNYSAAFGANTTASGNGSAAFGDSSTAGGFASFAAGNLTTANGGGSVALGNEAMVATGGDLSMAFGLGDATGAVPRVSGDGSFGIFMGDQSGVDVTANNVMTLLGGSLVIDIDGTSATNLDISRAGMGIDVQGDIGAVNYCDQNGANCFSALDVTSGGVGVWEDASNVIRLTSGTVNYASADFVFGSPQLSDDGLPEHRSRFFFDKSSGAFRAGNVSGTHWDPGSLGDYSVAMGANTNASGQYSFAMGATTTASGYGATAIGSTVLSSGSLSLATGELTVAAGDNSAAFGREVNVTSTGDGSVGFGLTTGSIATDPRISGSQSFGIFMGNQNNVNFASANTMGLFGGKMIIDSAAPATQLTTSGSLSLDVEGDVGAINYCDENGQNCFTAAGVSSGSFAAGNDRELQFNSNGALGADVNLVFTSAGYLGIGTNAPAAPLHTVGDFLNTGTYTGTASAPASGAGTRMFFDTEMSAFRAGSVAGTEWDNGNIGAFSTAIGSGAIASGLRSTAIGYITNALGQDSVALGGPGSTASGENSLALGRYVVAGDGVANSGFGDGSMAIGLISDAYAITTPSQVSGNQSLGIFMGDQDGLVMSATNTMGLFGGKMVIDPKVPATQLAARSVLDLGAATDAVVMPSGDTAQRPASPVNGMLRYNSANGKFEGYQAGVWQDILTGAASSTFLSLTDTPASYAGAANQYVRINAATNALEFTNEIVRSVTGQPAPDYMGLNDLLDVDLSVAPTGGQMLQYNSASGLWVAGTPSASSVTAAGADREIQFNSGGNFAASSNFIYTADGKIGLGASSPLATLHVQKTGDEATMRFTGDGTWNDVVWTMQSTSSGNVWQYSMKGPSDPNYGKMIWEHYDNGLSQWSSAMTLSKDGKVGTGNITSPQADLDIGGVGAVLVPRGTTAQRPASPVNGMLRYNSQSGKFEGYQGGAWQDILTGAATSTFLSLTDTPASYAGVANQYVRVNAATNALEFTNEIVRSVAGQPDPDYIDLNDISDVNLTVAPTDGQVLRFDSATGMWVAGSGGGGTFLALTDTPSAYTGAENKFVRVNAGATALEFIEQIPVISGQPLPSFLVLNDMDDVDLTVAPTGGQFLQYNSTSGKWVAASASGGGGGGAIDDLSDAISNTTSTVFLGTGSGAASTGSGNTGVGINAMASNVAKQENTAVGFEAMRYANDSAVAGITYNTALGAYALRGSTTAANNTGTNNTALGHNALMSTTSGSWNTAVGDQALKSLSTGVDNVAVGDNAGNLLTTGGANSMLGSGALFSNVSGNNNVGVGWGAMGDNVAKSENTAIGYKAMWHANDAAATSVTYNTALGAYALQGSATAADNTGTYNTALGHSALASVTSGSNNLGIGAGAGDSITTGNYNIIIGYNLDTPAAGTSNYLNIGDSIFGDMGAGNIEINGTAALTVPRGDTSQRPTGVNGMIRYNSQTSKLEAYQAGAWVDMIGGGSSTFLALTDTPASYAASGSKYVRVNSGATALEFTDEIVGTVTGQPAPNFMDLDDLSDVNLSVAPTNGQVLSYNGTSWVAAAAGGGGGTPAGANGEVQFNSNGSFGATPGFAWLNPGILLHTGNVNKTASIIPQAPGDALLSLVANNNGVTSEFVVDSGEGFKMYYHGAEFMRLASSGNLGIGTAAPQAKIHTVTDAASSNTVIEAFRMQRSNSGGAGAAGLGAGMNTYLETSTNGTVNLASRFETQVITAAPASFATRMSLYPYYNNLETLGAHFSGTSTGIRLGIGINAPSYDLGFNGGQARSIGVERVLGAAPGVNLTVQAGGTMSGGNNLNGGNLVLNSGIATGNGSSSILFQTVAMNQGAGTTDRLPATAMTLAANALTIPAGSTAERPGQIGMQAAVNGMIRYNSQTAKFEGYQAGAWVDMIGGGGSIDALSDAISNTTSTVFLGTGSGVSSTGTGNTGVGIYALASNVAKQDSTAIGYQAMRYANDSAAAGIEYNTAVGAYALRGSTTASANTGRHNTAVGHSSLVFNTNGDDNSALGTSALGSNTTGDDNTAVGAYALTAVSTGSFNTAMGQGALQASIASGSTAVGAHTLALSSSGSNTAFGYQAGNSITTGTGNLLFGYDVDTPTATTDNYLNIGNVITGTITTGDIAVNGTAALTLPRGDTSQRPTGVNGMIRYNSQTAKFEGYQAGVWVDMIGGGGGGGSIDSLSDAITEYASGNMFLGQNSGVSETTAIDNVALGNEALKSVTDGQYNIGIGSYALTTVSTGDFNTAVGYAALKDNTDSFNTAFGYRVLRSNTSGSANTAMGYMALDTNLTGTNNTAIGMNALSTNVGKQDSTAVGYEAMRYADSAAAASSTYNTAVGAYALRGSTTAANNTGVSNTAVGYSALRENTTGTFNTAAGDDSLRNNTTGGYNTAFGQAAMVGVPGTPLTGNYNSAFGTNALYSIQGAATFNTAVGHDSLRNNTTGSYNTAVGQDAMLGDSGVPLTGSYNSAFGTNALYKIQGAAINNTALGHDSLRYNTTGASNTAVGQSAMLGVSGTPLTGGGNVAMGKDALMTIQGVASNNVAIGMSALKANTTQSGSVAIGFEALMTTATALGNTAVGYQALRLNQTGGIDNTALGYQALDANTTGDYNVALGRETLGANQTGSANLAIGSSALQNVVSASNNVAIGIDALNTTSAGNNTAIGFSAGSNLTTGTGNIMIGYDADAPVAAGSNQLNIGGTIYGDLSQDRIGIGAVPAAGVELDVTGDIQYTGILTDVSDMRLKTDIHPLRDRGSMLEKIGQIDTYSFRMKDDKEGQVEFGVMAQEMQKVFPELVQVDVSSPEKYMSVNYMGMIAPLVAATQELKAENDNLKAQLGSLESKMASIEADMKGMKAHTGYGIGKAGFGMGMAAGLGLMGGLGGVIAFRRRRKAG